MPHRRLASAGKRLLAKFIIRSCGISVNKLPTHLRLQGFGSTYGRWTFVHDEGLYNSTLLSCGLGEDCSFDLEFAAAYKAKVIFIDPTPRAIEHFEEVVARCGCPRSSDYKPGGKQPIYAYELTNVTQGQLSIMPVAAWICEGTAKFYQPQKTEWVSCSLQQSATTSQHAIEVQTKSLAKIWRECPEEPKLVKLDIEHAEVEVIEHLLNQSIYPPQILVELDDANLYGFNKARLRNTNQLLVEKGYRCVHWNGRQNFLYVRLDKLNAGKA